MEPEAGLGGAEVESMTQYAQLIEGKRLREKEAAEAFKGGLDFTTEEGGERNLDLI